MSAGIDPTTLYLQLVHCVASMPSFRFTAALTLEQQEWLGMTHALVEGTGALTEAHTFRQRSLDLSNKHIGPAALEEVTLILHRAVGRAKLRSPASVSQALLPVNASFDAFATIAGILTSATSAVMIVDPYLDYKVLEFARAAHEHVVIQLLTDSKQHGADFLPAVDQWWKQFGKTRPLEVRLAPKGALHDRMIFLDGTVAWTLTQSFNKLAARSPAEIVRVDHIAAEKIAAYTAYWSTATPHG